MKNIPLLILCLFINYISYAKQSDTIPADNPFIEYSGRIDFSDTLAPQFSYSGVSIRANFKGTSISILLNDEGTQNFYNIILDNLVIKRIQTIAGLNTYEIANGLSDSVHEIEIYKLTEKGFGITQFHGFIIDSGKTVVPLSNKRDRIIEFIGNSITCGYGNEGSGSGTFGPTTENNYLTYGAVTARYFNARYYGVCASGIGLYRNYGCSTTEDTYSCMLNYYNRTISQNPTPLYTYSPKPDLICIDLGTNDFSGGQGDSAKFINKYLQFIDTLQLKNKSADIICLVGPILFGNNLDLLRRYTFFIADSANKKNKGKVYFFELSQELGDLGYGLNGHPSVAQHNKNANELISYIKTIKNWESSPYIINGQTNKANEIILTFDTQMSDSSKFKGFIVAVDSVDTPIENAFVDSIDQAKIHLLLADNVIYGQNILVSYSSGSIVNSKNLKLKTFSSFPVTNNLTETKIVSASINNTENVLTISINKKIIPLTNLDGITIYDANNTILLTDSFTVINNTTISIYLKNKIKIDDSIYVTISSNIFGQDLIGITPVTKFEIQHINTIATNIQSDNVDLIVYPNPSFTKKFTYSLPNISGQIHANIYDLQGRLLLTQSLNSNEGQVDLYAFNIQNGCYILTIVTSQKTYSKTIYLYSKF